MMIRHIRSYTGAGDITMSRQDKFRGGTTDLLEGVPWIAALVPRMDVIEQRAVETRTHLLRLEEPNEEEVT